MRLSVNHTTVYSYSEPARRIVQLLRLTPASFAGQTVLDWRVDVDCDAHLRKGWDGYGNVTHMLYVAGPVQRLCISVTGLVIAEDQSGIVRGLAADLPPLVFTRATPLTAAGEALAPLAVEVAQGAGSTLDRLHRLNAQLHRDLQFDTCGTGVETQAEQAFRTGRGVCQDFAHIFIAVVRGAGMPARYVSGHLFRRDGAEIQEASHAWAEAWVEDLGWVAFDPANGICPDDSYVRVAAGLDYRASAPIAGARAGGGREDLSVEVQVREARSQAQSQSQN